MKRTDERRRIEPDPLTRMEMEAYIDKTEPGLIDDLGIRRCVQAEKMDEVDAR